MKMYLLFEWTEERESKNHVGIYSTVEKAKAAGELSHGDELEWVEENWSSSPVWRGDKPYDDDYPYEIDEFEVDVYDDYKWGPGTDNPTIERHEL